MADSGDISAKIFKKIKEIADDDAEISMITELLRLEQEYGHDRDNMKLSRMRQDFSSQLVQHFPLPREITDDE